MNGIKIEQPRTEDELLQLNLELKNLKKEDTYSKFHGDDLIGVSIITYVQRNFVNQKTRTNMPPKDSLRTSRMAQRISRRF